MILFWIVAAALTALAAAAVAGPLMRPPRAEAAGEEPRVALLRERIAALEPDVAAGLVPADEAAGLRVGLGRELLEAAGQEPPPQPSPASGEGGGRSGALARAAGEGWVGASSSRIPRRLGTALILLLPAATVALYLTLGRPDLIAAPPQGPDRAQLAARQAERAKVEGAAERLAAKLAEAPDDLQGWVLLAETERRLGNWRLAVEPLRHALALKPGEPALTVALAETLVMANGGTVGEEARRLAAAVPDDPRARFYLALARDQEGDTAGALAAWRAMLAEGPADAPWRDAVEARVRDAAARLGQAPGPSQADVAAAAEMTPEQRQQMIAGMVERLAARLKEHPEDTEGWLRLAKARGTLGDRPGALAALDAAVASAPDRADVRAERARVAASP